MESELLHLTILSVRLLPCQQTFPLFTDTGLATVKVQLGISVDTSVDSFFCFLDCTVSSDLSCDIVLGRDWFAFVSHAFPNATITLSETGIRLMEQGSFSPALVFDERN